MTLRHDDLESLQTRMTIEVAQSLDAVREAQALRHQVFCLERKFFDAVPTTGLEQDPFDQYARHLVVRRSSDREVIATSRIVRSRMTKDGAALPMHKYCCPTLFRSLPMESVGEISRFAISKHARGTETSSGPTVRLLLLRGILHTSQAMGLTHWCALMEPSLIRLLSMTGIQFDALGSLVECSGQRLPCVARIDHAVSRGRMSHPDFYEAVATRRYSGRRKRPLL